MPVSTKVRMLMTMKRKNAVQMASYMGIHQQSYRNKLTRESFSSADLIEIAELLGAKLLFEVDGQRILFGREDLDEERLAHVEEQDKRA